MEAHEPITVEAAPVFDLDLEKIGAVLRMIPAISARVGHRSARATLGYGVATTPETEFVRDLYSMTTPEMIEKWYGGMDNAARFAAGAAEEVAAALQTHRKRPRPAVDPA